MTIDQQAAPDEAPAPTFPDQTGSPPSTAAPGGGPAATADAGGKRRGGTRYNVLLSLLFILSCLGIATSTVVVWVHQVALNTDRWVSVVGPLPQDPDVRLAVSTKIADKVVTGLDIQGRLESVLPGPADIIAAPIANQVEQGIQTRLEAAMATPQFQTAWVAANRIAHQKVVDILRGNSQSIYVQNGYVVLDVWPLVGIALQQLQAQGIIPSTVQLPDLSQGLPAGAFDRLNSVLGGRIPADLGTIPLVPADKLQQAQRVVSIFDWITVLLVLVTIALVLTTIWYSARRRRTIALLAIGGAIAVVLARFALQQAQGAIVGSFDDGNTATIVGGVVSQSLGDLYGWSRLVIVAGVIVGLVAYLSGRPSWAVALTGQAAQAGSRAAAGVGSATASARAGAPSRDTATGWARANRRQLNVVGIAAIAFVLLWIAAGFWVALLGVALVAMLEFGLGLLGGPQTGAAPTQPSDAGVPPEA